MFVPPCVYFIKICHVILVVFIIIRFLHMVPGIGIFHMNVYARLFRRYNLYSFSAVMVQTL